MTTDNITEIETISTARILDNDLNEWEAGYLMAYRRLKTVRMIDDVEFNNDIVSCTSRKFLSIPYSKFELLIDITIDNTPTDLLIEVMMSEDGARWFKHMIGPFGDLRYVGAAGNKMEAVGGDIRSRYVKLKATATGTDATNIFTLSLDITLASM